MAETEGEAADMVDHSHLPPVMRADDRVECVECGADPAST